MGKMGKKVVFLNNNRTSTYILKLIFIEVKYFEKLFPENHENPKRDAFF